MDYLWDTSILLNQVRQSPAFFAWDDQLNFFHPENRNFISIVTEGEIHSIAIQRNWKQSKLQELGKYLNALVPLTIAKHSVINAYAEIDAFSQGKLSGKLLPKGMTSCNMGKNDLWIAATAHVISATLVTTDADFDHLAISLFLW
jgi:predicted nucleic acid-binding protein